MSILNGNSLYLWPPSSSASFSIVLCETSNRPLGSGGEDSGDVGRRWGGLLLAEYRQWLLLVGDWEWKGGGWGQRWWLWWVVKLIEVLLFNFVFFDYPRMRAESPEDEGWNKHAYIDRIRAFNRVNSLSLLMHFKWKPFVSIFSCFCKYLILDIVLL